MGRVRRIDDAEYDEEEQNSRDDDWEPRLALPQYKKDDEKDDEADAESEETEDETIEDEEEAEGDDSEHRGIVERIMEWLFGPFDTDTEEDEDEVILHDAEVE